MWGACRAAAVYTRSIRTPSKHLKRMLKASFSIEIGRPAADVYRLISNHENDVRWQSVVADVRKISPGPARR